MLSTVNGRMTARNCGRNDRGFTLIELMIVVSILGMLSVVAVPSFVRYMRVAKTAETSLMLSKITRGSIAYYSKSWHNEDGTPQKCQFPGMGIGSAAPSASGTFCCSDGEPDGKCEPNETAWNEPVWRALLFKIADKHYYTYEYISGALGPYQGNNASAVIIARGDLDCDGTTSKFMQMIQGNTTDANEILNCTARPKGSVIVWDETE